MTLTTFKTIAIEDPQPVDLTDTLGRLATTHNIKISDDFIAFISAANSGYVYTYYKITAIDQETGVKEISTPFIRDFSDPSRLKTIDLTKHGSLRRSIYIPFATDSEYYTVCLSAGENNCNKIVLLDNELPSTDEHVIVVADDINQWISNMYVRPTP